MIADIRIQKKKYGLKPYRTFWNQESSFTKSVQNRVSQSGQQEQGTGEQINNADDVGIVSHDEFKREPQHQPGPQRQSTTDGSMRMIRLRRRQNNEITPNLMPMGLIQGIADSSSLPMVRLRRSNLPPFLWGYSNDYFSRF